MAKAAADQQASRIQSLASTVVAQQKQYIKIETENEAKTKEAADAKAQAAQNKAEAEQINDRYRDLAEKHRKALAIIDELTERLNAAQAQAKAAQTTASSEKKLAQELASKEEKVADLTAKNQEIEKRIDSLRKKLKEFRDNEPGWLAAQDTWKANNDTLSTEIAKLKSGARPLWPRILIGSFVVCGGVLGGFALGFAGVKGAKEEVKQVAAELSKTRDDLTSVQSRLAAELSKTRDDLTSVQSRLDDTRRERAGLTVSCPLKTPEKPVQVAGKYIVICHGKQYLGRFVGAVDDVNYFKDLELYRKE